MEEDHDHSQSTNFNDLGNKDICYCFITELEPKCKITCHIQKFKSPPLTKKDPEVPSSGRTDLEKIRDIIQILNMNYEPSYKAIVDNNMNRDISIKEKEESIFKTKKDIRRLVSEWKKNNKIEDNKIFEEIKDDSTASAEYKDFFETFNEKHPTVHLNLDQKYLHTLPSCKIFLKNKSNKFHQMEQVIDSASSHYCIPFHLYQTLGYSEDDIIKSENFTLHTASDQDKDIILGTFQTKIYFLYNNNYFYFPVKAIILNSSINYTLMDIASLRSCSFQLSHQKDHDKLQLTLRNSNNNKKATIECLLKCTNVMQCHNLIIHNQKILDKLEPDQITLTEDIEKQLTSSETDVSEIAFQRNKIVSEHDPDMLRENLSNCTEEEQIQLKKLLQKYETIFARHRYSCGDFKLFQVKIEPLPGKRTKQKPRKHAPHQIKAVEEVIENCLKYGILEPCTHPQPWDNAVLIQKKQSVKQNSKADIYARKLKDFRENKQNKQNASNNTNQAKSETTYRLLNDFRLSNLNCRDTPKIHLPTFQDIHLKCKNKIVAQFDVKNCFYHLKIEKSCRHLTSFIWKNTRLQYRKLLQGFKGSPYWSKMMLDRVFSKETLQEYKKENSTVQFNIDTFLDSLLVYMDDFLLFSETYSDHYRDIDIVLWCCKHHDLHLNISKCSFYLTEFIFLGSYFNVKTAMTTIHPERKQAMLHWPQPRSTMEVHSRLCQLAYSSIYLPGLRQVAYALYYLCTVDFYWDSYMQISWENVLMLIKLSISLTLFDVNKISILSCDSSVHCYSFNLMQFNKTTKGLDLIDTQTRLHNKSHNNRLIIQKEIMSIQKALTYHELNIRAAIAPFYLLTDSITLQYLKSNMDLNHNLYNFSLMLADFSNVCLLALPTYGNMYSDLQSRLYTRQYPKIMQAEAEHLNEKFFKSEMIITNQQIIDYLFTPTPTSIDCNPKLKRSEIKHQKPYDRIVEIFQEPNELQWLKAQSKNLDLIQKDHRIWSNYRSDKPINQSDLIALTKKYRLSDLDWKAFVMMTNFKKSNHLLAFQNEIYSFVDQAIEFIKTSSKNTKILQKLNYFKNLPQNEQFLLLQQLDYFFQSEFNFNIKDLTTFVQLVPYYTESNDIEIKQSNNGIQLHLKQNTTIHKGKLFLLSLDLLFFSKSNCIFFEPGKIIKKCIYSSPFSNNKPWHYFNSMYIFSPSRLEVKKEDYLFLIKGFTPEYQFYFPNYPDQFSTTNEVKEQIKHQNYNKNFYLEYEPCKNECHNIMKGKQIKDTQTIPIMIQKTKLIDSFRNTNKTIITHLSELLDIHINILKDQNENSCFDTSELVQTLLTDIQPINHRAIVPRSSFNQKNINPKIVNSLLFLQNLLNFDGKLDEKQMLKLQLSSPQGQKFYIYGQNDENDFHIINNILYRINKCSTTGKYFYQLYIPNNIAELLMSYLHHNLFLHVSKQELLRIFQRSFWTENAPEIAKKCSNSCLTCSITKSVKISQHIGEERQIKPSQPNFLHFADLMHGLPVTKNNNSFILLVVDPYSYFCMARPMATTTAEETLSKYQEICSITSYPCYFVSDYGGSFRGPFSEYLKSVMVVHYKSTSQRSQNQSSVEAAVKHLRNFITRAILNSNQTNRDLWDIWLHKIIISYNSQSYYQSKISRINLQFGTGFYNNLSCNFLDDEKDQNLNYLNRIFETKCKYAKSKLLKNHIYPGMLVCKLVKNDQQQSQNSSRYLFPSSSNIYLVLYSNHMSLKIKNLNTGDISTCDASLCRKLTLNEISSYSKYFSPNFPNIFNVNRYLKGNQPQYLDLQSTQSTIEDIKEADIVNPIESEKVQDTNSDNSSSTEVKDTNKNNKDNKALTIKYPSEIEEIKDITKKTSTKATKNKMKVKSDKKLKVRFNEKVKVRQHATKWGKKNKEWYSDIIQNQNDVKVNFLLASIIPHDVTLKEMCLTKDRKDFILYT